MNILLLMMGGKGERFGAKIPKQYVEIDKKPIFSYIVSGYDKSPEIHYTILVSHCDWIDYVTEQMNALKANTPWTVVAGGANRSESVLNGLCSAKQIGNDEDVVLIHDATHPYVDLKGTSEVIQAVHEFGGATLGAFQYDTMYQMNTDNVIEKVIPRRLIVSGASPEAFRLADIYRIYSEATFEELEKMTSAGAIALAHRIKMKVIPSNCLNLKITHAEDMGVFKCLCHTYFFDKSDLQTIRI